jgi:uncharacterized protein (TIGR00159 family)
MFFEFSIKDFVDIVLVAVLLYWFYKIMAESGSKNVFLGILVFLLSWVFVSKVLHMRLLGSIFDQLMSVGTLTLVILFHDEIRNFFRTLGSQRHFRYISSFFSKRGHSSENDTAVMPIVLACMNMAQQKVGALIVIERKMSLIDVASTGETVNADINQRLIEAVFFKNAPLHDGAMIVRDGRILAAQCILPVSRNVNIPKKLGLRHRSAMGISEISDAVAIVVSEETGTISAAVNGKLMHNIDARRLESLIAG